MQTGTRPRSAWLAGTARGFGRALHISPFQVAEPVGFGLDEPDGSVVAGLMAGMPGALAARRVHPCMDAEAVIGLTDAGRLFARIAAARTGEGRPVVVDVDVLFVNGDQYCPPCTHYRVLNPVEILRERGWSVTAVDAADLHRLSGCDIRARVVVVFRALPDPVLSSWLDRLRRHGAHIVFDVDDLLFDGPRSLTAMQFGEGPGQRLDPPGSERGRAAMAGVARGCDEHWAPTEDIAAAFQAEGIGEEPMILPSTLSSTQLAVGAATPRAPSGNRVTIGYSSGTATHAADFAVAAPALRSVLRAYPDARLVVFGPLDVGAFDLPAHQVIHDEVVTRGWGDLMRRMASIDINVVPLEILNGYCRAKSEVKYLEAGCVGTPTLATPTPAYARAITHGETGLLASDEAAWTEALMSFIADQSLRRRLGAAAQEDVAARYGPSGRYAGRYLAAIDALHGGDRSTPEVSAGWASVLGSGAEVDALRDPARVLIVVDEGLSDEGDLIVEAIRTRWPGLDVAVVGLDDAGVAVAGRLGIAAWRPGDSLVDLATALRRARVVIAADSVPDGIAALVAASGVPTGVWNRQEPPAVLR